MSNLPSAELSKKLGAALHIWGVVLISVLYFAGVNIPLGVAWPIWGLFNLLLVPVTYRRVFQTPEVSELKCQRSGSMMETKMVKCTNPNCGWVFGEPSTSTNKGD